MFANRTVHDMAHEVSTENTTSSVLCPLVNIVLLTDLPFVPYEAVVICAEADGVAPALLLRPMGEFTSRYSNYAEQRGEYLINMPDGSARLALEHHVRPKRNLRAAFLTSLGPDAAADVGCVLFRLKQEGHGALEICGPPGTAAYCHALRHSVGWKHPK
ncbi:unnamed protein product, partial [Closterium sp. NIES-53]